jgi:hypothetical protein
MLRFHKVGIPVLVFTVFANAAAAQSANHTSGRDSLWNGALIGLGQAWRPLWRSMPCSARTDSAAAIFHGPHI